MKRYTYLGYMALFMMEFVVMDRLCRPFLFHQDGTVPLNTAHEKKNNINAQIPIRNDFCLSFPKHDTEQESMDRLCRPLHCYQCVSSSRDTGCHVSMEGQKLTRNAKQDVWEYVLSNEVCSSSPWQCRMKIQHGCFTNLAEDGNREKNQRERSSNDDSFRGDRVTYTMLLVFLEVRFFF